MKKIYSIFVFFLLLTSSLAYAQALRIPQDTNLGMSAGRRLGATEINIKWNAPGVKGREGKIWGTDVAPFGFTVLGYGSNVLSPWRAGADECTTISFSTDVKINGKNLVAGNYALFMALYADSTILIFNKNVAEWGAYFYNDKMDVLRVKTVQQKNQATTQEKLVFTFSKQTANNVEAALEWENWRIPFIIEVDLKRTTLASIKSQMSGVLAFDPPSLEAAATWCLNNETNYEEALNWLNSAVDPNLGGVINFRTLSTKSKLLEKLGKQEEASKTWKQALEVAGAQELHQFGRQLLSESKNKEALEIFELNFKKQNGAWPTNAGLMRGYSANGNLKKALEHAKLALNQAPEDQSKKIIAAAIKTLEAGKPL